MAVDSNTEAAVYSVVVAPLGLDVKTVDWMLKYVDLDSGVAVYSAAVA